jgi:outer membrane protein assembly factor BamB
VCETLALHPDSGELKWRAFAGNSDASPTVADRKVFVPFANPINSNHLFLASSGVQALNATTGQQVWRYNVPSAGHLTEVGSSERAIAGTYADSIYYQAIPTADEIVALAGSNGKLLWRFATAAPSKMSPVIVGGHVYIGDTAGILYVLDSYTGKPLRTFLFRSPFATSPPVVVGRTMLLVNDSYVYAFPLP